MKRFIETSIPIEAALCALVALSAPGLASGASLQQEFSEVDAVFADVDTDHTPGCSVSVIDRGELLFAGGYGMANLEYDVPIAPNSIFHVASVSKQFTAMAVALLVAEGRVSWDDDIRRHVPEVPDFGHTITLGQLVHHISGIRDQWDLLGMAGWRFEADVIKQEDVLDITSRQRALNFIPGAEYLYSNTGFTLLAVVVERVSGKSLREFTTERIFEPLGMADTHFHDDHNMIVRNRAYGYRAREDGYRISIPDFDVVGATSLFTTVEDMARWDRNFITAEVGGATVVEQLHERGVLNNGERISYAYGLAHGRYRGLPTVGHGGSDAGYRSNFMRFPEQGISIAVLCNFPTSNPAARAQRVADTVLKDAFTEAAGNAAAAADGDEGVEVSSERLQALAGYYVAPDTDALQRIRIRDGGLIMGGGGGRRLIALDESRFRLAGSQTVIAFSASEGRLEMRLMGSGGLRLLIKAAMPRTGANSDYVGTYFSAELGTQYKVERTAEGLRMWHRKRGYIPMRATAEDRFQAGRAISFTRGDDGNVNGFTMSSGRVRKVRFERVDGQGQEEE